MGGVGGGRAGGVRLRQGCGAVLLVFVSAAATPTAAAERGGQRKAGSDPSSLSLSAEYAVRA
jgi:hypothetical protein